MEKKTELHELMGATMEKIRSMVDTNTIVGTPITTPDGVTLIPISKVSFGFGTGGGDYGKTAASFAGGGGAGVRIDPVAFLVMKDGGARMLPVAASPATTVDRIIDMAPDVVDRVERFFESRKSKEED